MKKFFLIFLFILPLFLLADKTYDPWYTGTLLSSGGDNIEKGKFNIQPYFLYRENYDKQVKTRKIHSIANAYIFETDLSFQMGLTTWLNLTLEFRSFYKEREGEKAFKIKDTTATFGFQIIKQKELTPIPSIRLELEQSIPSGKYKNLNPKKNGVDASGSGSYETSLSFLTSKIVYWITNHPINWIFNLSYTHSTNVKVSNFNTYGGGYNTKGTIKPGHLFEGYFAFEFSFTQRWVYAMDFYYKYLTKTKFHGNPGISEEGKPVEQGIPMSTQFSLAPILEYNFNKNLGIFGGVLFPVIEKNTLKFITGFLSVTYTF